MCRLDAQRWYLRHLMCVPEYLLWKSNFELSFFCFIYSSTRFEWTALHQNAVFVVFFLLIAPFALCRTLQTFFLAQILEQGGRVCLTHTERSKIKALCWKVLFILYIVNMHKQRNLLDITYWEPLIPLLIAYKIHNAL